MQRIHLSLDTTASNVRISDYTPYSLHNFRQLPQIKRLSEDELFAIEVVGHVLPFKTNNYVVNELIDWSNVPQDPMFILNFPQKDMLQPHHFNELAQAIKNTTNKLAIKKTVNKIRMQLNPHPAGQLEQNIPWIEGQRLSGIQHKYKETVLFFPSQGQTCHAYCTFCFRWPQFSGINDLKIGMHDVDMLVKYVQNNIYVTDILFTGGDPLIMKAKTLAAYLNPLLDANILHLRTIRIGTKSLSYWPYRFLTDPDSEELLALFKRVARKGKHLAIMAHFNHTQELKTQAVKEAIARIRQTGAQIRTQSPLLSHINDDPKVWTQMWKEQVRLGCTPYYMFIPRDTGAQHYFSVPLEQSWKIYQQAYQNTSGLCRTVRGPSMSAAPGKIEILGISEIEGKRVFVLRMLQGRDPDWAMRPFFAKYNENAVWLNDLEPAFGKKRFFFET